MKDYNYFLGESATIKFAEYIKVDGKNKLIESLSECQRGDNRLLSTNSEKMSGYLSEAEIIALASNAGFVLEAKSEINANLNDTKDYEKGVWALPPGLATSWFKRKEHMAIGQSDRMTLKFRKPLL